jgi:hypothetical protein
MRSAISHAVAPIGIRNTFSTMAAWPSESLQEDVNVNGAFVLFTSDAIDRFLADRKPADVGSPPAG